MKQKSNFKSPLLENKSMGSIADLWLERISAASQPCLLALGVFGYFYTVVPVFQNQKLQEDNAKLEIEKERFSSDIQELIKEKGEAERLLSDIQQQLKHQAELAKSLQVELADLKDKELQAKEKLDSANVALKKQQKDLDFIRWDKLMVGLILHMGWDGLRGKNIYDIDEDKNAIFVVTENISDGYELLLSSIDDLSVSKSDYKIPAHYYAELRKFVVTNEGKVRCGLSDVEGIQLAYDKDMTEAVGRVESIVESEVSGIKAEYAKKNQEVLITDEYRQDARRRAKIAMVFEVKSKYASILSDRRSKCMDKVNSLLDEFMNSKKN